MNEIGYVIEYTYDGKEWQRWGRESVGILSFAQAQIRGLKDSIRIYKERRKSPSDVFPFPEGVKDFRIIKQTINIQEEVVE